MLWYFISNKTSQGYYLFPPNNVFDLVNPSQYVFLEFSPWFLNSINVLCLSAYLYM